MARAKSGDAFASLTKLQNLTFRGVAPDGGKVEIVVKPLRGTDNLIGFQKAIKSAVDNASGDAEGQAKAFENVMLEWLPKIVVSVSMDGVKHPDIKSLKRDAWAGIYGNLGGFDSPFYSFLMGALGLHSLAGKRSQDEWEDDDHLPFS